LTINTSFGGLGSVLDKDGRPLDEDVEWKISTAVHLCLPVIFKNSSVHFDLYLPVILKNSTP